MSEMPNIIRSEHGWTVPMLPEMAQAADVPEGSFIVLHLEKGSVTAEIIPPATDEMKRSVRASADKFKDAFAELKRLGD